MKDGLSGPASRIFFSQRLRLHYVDWGNPGAPTMLLLHGGRDHCRNWDWLAEEFRNEFHVVAPDLRGHGDSQWSMDGNYTIQNYVYDLAQLVDQQALAPIHLVAHSLGGRIALRFSGIYPGKVKKLVAIEGLSRGPRLFVNRLDKPAPEKMRIWIDEVRGLAGRLPRRYASFDEAVARMQGENKRLSPEQVRHLTAYAVNQNEDGTYSWKFDNYVRMPPPYEMSEPEIEEIWRNVSCPTLLVNGTESFVPLAEQDEKKAFFSNVRTATVEGAGHWVHHDRFDAFRALVRNFIAEP